MENVKKMILIEPELIDKLKQEHASDNVLSRLDTEMHKILKRNVGDREKWSLYMQTLQRYLHFTEQDRKSFKLPIIAEETDHSIKNLFPSGTNKVLKSHKSHSKNNESTLVEQVTKQEDALPSVSGSLAHYTSDYISRLLPKTFKKKGELLMDTINKHRDKIYWNDDGTIVVNNELIPGSNIADLINDALRRLKRPRPRGWEKFVVALKDIKVPLYCIGNPKTLEYMNNLYLSEFRETTPSKEPLQITPSPASQNRRSRSSSESRKLNKKIDWERWTPY